MQLIINNSILEFIQGDITLETTDAIVNAANTKLIPGGGVDGAIHRAAGPMLRKETASIGGCPTGEARLTKGYNPTAKYVIHTPGPVYHGKEIDAELLANCYKNCLKLADEHKIKSISFPSISTGVYGYPIEEASKIALNTIVNYLKTQATGIQLVHIVLFSSQDYDIYLSLSSPK
jgi:O-acetyl-ADP-ribose deacetylase (regulator of RNase III)